MTGPLQMVPTDGDDAVCVDGVCALPGAAAEPQDASPETRDDASGSLDDPR